MVLLLHGVLAYAKDYGRNCKILCGRCQQPERKQERKQDRNLNKQTKDSQENRVNFIIEIDIVEIGRCLKGVYNL